MTETIAAVLVPTSGPPVKLDLPTDNAEQLRVLQEHIGGFIEAVMMATNPPIVMFCNEDGHALDLPPNAFATAIAVAYTPIVLGNVVLTGPADRNGDTTALDPRWVDQLVQA